MKICSIDSQNETHKDFPIEDEDRNIYLLDVAKKVVDTVWEQVSSLDIKAVLDAHDDGEESDDEYYEYCYCKEGTLLLLKILLIW